MSQSRQLAAIMFTDISGHTALMGEDEHKTFEQLSRNRLIACESSYMVYLIPFTKK